MRQVVHLDVWCGYYIKNFKNFLLRSTKFQVDTEPWTNAAHEKAMATKNPEEILDNVLVDQVVNLIKEDDPDGYEDDGNLGLRSLKKSAITQKLRFHDFFAALPKTVIGDEKTSVFVMDFLTYNHNFKTVSYVQ